VKKILYSQLSFQCLHDPTKLNVNDSCQFQDKVNATKTHLKNTDCGKQGERLTEPSASYSYILSPFVLNFASVELAWLGFGIEYF